MDKQHLLRQCRSLIPLATMREDHLLAALDEAVEVTACKDDILLGGEDDKSCLYYLLSGEVLLTHQRGQQRIITADFHWLPIVQFQTKEFKAHAITDCELIRFDAKKLDNLLTWSQVADYLEVDISYERKYDEDSSWMLTVLNSHLFYKIAPLKVLSIFSKMTSKNVRAGDVMISQGSVGDYCYFIKAGRAVVTRASKMGEAKVSVAEISTNGCFGEDALIADSLGNASVVMLTDGVLIGLHKDDFAALLTEPSFSHVSCETLATLKNQRVAFLDVRSQEEYDYKHIIDAVHIPLVLLRLKIRLLDVKKHYVIYCNTGSRSTAAALLLKTKGYRVSLLEGGLANISEDDVKRLLVSEFDAIHQLADSSN
jgi:rhodanese-related sulfurtransferase